MDGRRKVCKNCKKEFTIKRGWYSQQKFCSKKCYLHSKYNRPMLGRKGRNAPLYGRIGKDHPSWKGGKIERGCKKCGKIFLCYEDSYQEFCSKGCFQRKRFEENPDINVGSNNPMYGRKRNLSKRTRKKIGKIAKERWKDRGYASKVLSSNEIRPNKKEKELRWLFNYFVPGEFKYTGNGDVIIGGKNPDFVNVNGKKQVAELFGSYWHDKGDGAKRKRHFKKYGIDCLVVWEKELKHPDKLGWKILDFAERKS